MQEKEETLVDTKKTVVLVAFYNKKALGVRYLESALAQRGYAVRSVFYKNFNNVRPLPTTERELELLRGVIRQAQPLFVGLSVMSSMYLDTVWQVLDAAKSCGVPVVCGGAFASMYPEMLLERGADFVIRTDGETAICRLAEALEKGTPFQNIPCLCYRENGETKINPIGDLEKDLDAYGLPVINSRSACFIDRDTLTEGDPQLDTRSYEVVASRGCPFSCTYCCCPNLRRLLPKGIPGVRTRSVKNVIGELIEAKKHCKKIAFMHFYDEVFPNLPGWVDEFVAEYKKHIHMPFTIWSHPKMADLDVLKKLKSVGLAEVIMGIQTGSERIRREVFHRYETQEDIIGAVSAIQKAGVFWCTFDLMLQHPFESIDELKESYELVKRLPGRYELQLHGLNFLPGTDIVDMAIEEGYFTPEEMDGIMFAPMETQFNQYWKREAGKESQLWYQMIHCWQFRQFRRKLSAFEEDPLSHEAEIDAMYARAQKLMKLRYLYKKGVIVLKRLFS